MMMIIADDIDERIQIQAYGEPVALLNGYQFVVLDAISHIAPAAWNETVCAGAGSIFHTHEWLRAFELAPPGRFRPAHLVALDGSQIVGVCPAYLVEECPRLQYYLTEAGPVPLEPHRPILLAHSMAALAGGPVVRPGHEGARAGFPSALEHAARDLGAWAYGMANVENTSGLVGTWLGRGAATARLTTRYLLHNHWKDGAAYWAEMPPHRRRRLQAMHRKGRRRGARVRVGVAPDADMMALVHRLLRDRHTPTEVLPEPFLNALTATLQPYARHVVVEDESGHPLGLMLGWVLQDIWTLWIAGLDTAAMATYEPYHLLYAGIIEDAIATRLRAVNFGRSNDAIKRRYGCTREPLCLALQATTRQDTALLHRWGLGLEQQHLASLSTSTGQSGRARCC